MNITTKTDEIVERFADNFPVLMNVIETTEFHNIKLKVAVEDFIRTEFRKGMEELLGEIVEDKAIPEKENNFIIKGYNARNHRLNTKISEVRG